MGVGFCLGGWFLFWELVSVLGVGFCFGGWFLFWGWFLFELPYNRAISGMLFKPMQLCEIMVSRAEP